MVFSTCEVLEVVIVVVAIFMRYFQLLRKRLLFDEKEKRINSCLNEFFE